MPEKSPARSPDLGAIICEPDHSDELKSSETSDNEVTGNEEVRRSKLINTDTGQILDLFSAQDNGNIPSEAKVQEVLFPFFINLNLSDVAVTSFTLIFNKVLVHYFFLNCAERKWICKRKRC